MKAVFRLALAVVMLLALSPVLVYAAPPPPTGAEVFSDDFSDPSTSGLEDNRTAQDFERGVHDPGVYHLRLLNPDDVRWIVFPDHSYGDFTMQVELWDNSDEFAGDAALGVVFRVQDDTHLYAAMVDPRKGEYAIRKLDGAGSWSDLVAWTASPLIKQQAEHNLLRVDAKGDTFTVYLNDEMLATATDAAYAKGGMGFTVMNVDAVQPHMHFDNVAIYSEEGTAEQPAAEQPAAEQAPAGGQQQPGTLPNTGDAGASAPLVIALAALSLLILGASIRRARVC